MEQIVANISMPKRLACTEELVQISGPTSSGKCDDKSMY